MVEKNNLASEAASPKSAEAPHSPAGYSNQLIYYYLSEVLDRPVRYEGESRPFGRLHDIGAMTRSGYPPAVSLEVKAWRQGMRQMPWTSVVEFSPREIVVKRNGNGVPQTDFWVRRDVLDDQVVDVHGAKVVRVNDVHMLYTQGQLIFAHVDVGILGILRRLGWTRVVCGLLSWLLDYTIKEKFVTWRSVQVILPGGSPGGLRIPDGLGRLVEMHPAELADIIEDLGLEAGQTIFKSLPVETAADTLEEMDSQAQRTLISQEEPGKAADILEEMPASEAAAVLRDVHDADAERIISKMETGAAEDVKELLAHEEETAGGIMSTSCIEAGPNERAEVVLERVKAIANDAEVFSQIYVLDEGRHLVGVLNLRELLRAAAGTAIQDLMTTEIIKVKPDATHRDVAELLVKYGFRAVPVVDDRDVFLGAVRLMAVAGALAPLSRE